jgi:hypothetical protein
LIGFGEIAARLPLMTKDEWLVAAGCACLGLTIGWLVRFFIDKYKEYNAKILNSTVSVFFGGCIVAFLKYLANKETNLLVPASFYLIGLPVGMIVLYPLILHWDLQFFTAARYQEAQNAVDIARLQAKASAGKEQMPEKVGIPNPE